MKQLHSPQKLIQHFSLSVLLLFTLTQCRPADRDDDRAATLQSWSSEQAQGKLQPFPPTLSRRLQRLLDRSVVNQAVPGAVLYLSTSDGVWMGASGVSDLEKRLPLAPTDRFRVGNITKTFVAVVCLQLVEEGSLELDRPIAPHLPEPVRQQIKDSDRITLRELLNHTSGLPDPYDEAFDAAVKANPQHRWTAKELIARIADRPPIATRGNYAFSHSNYLLLQLIIEQVTGRSLAQEIQTRISEPLELKNTFLELHQPGKFVQGYQDRNPDGSIKNVTQPKLNAGLGMGDKGLISTAPDLVRFYRALFIENSLLQPDSLEAMLTHVGDRERRGSGLGIAYTPTLWGEAWGLTGRTIGFSSLIEYFPVHDLMIVVWTNTSEPGTDYPVEIATGSLDRILGDR